LRRAVFIVACGVSGWASADPIAGRVVDDHGKPVAGASVSVGDVHATTDARGQFTVDAPLGTDVVVDKQGFATALGVSATATDDITLISEGHATESETIVVHGEPPPVAQGAAHLDRETLERLPGTGNDLVKSLSAMPGVAQFPLPLGSSGVVIRGSSPQDSNVLIDDFEVPALYHDIGFRSIIPSEAIDSLDYVPGGFDVAYGRATSGIVQLTTRSGGEQRAEQAEVSGADAGAMARGPLGRGSYFLAVRRSTIDKLLPALLPDGLDLSLTTVPRYYDLQLRFDYKLSNHWDVRVSSLGSDDALELYASRDQNADKRFANRTRFIRTTAAARYHDGPWTANLALSGIAEEQSFERGLYQYLHVSSPALSARTEVTRTGPITARVGAEATATRYGIDMAMPAGRVEGEPLKPDDPMDTSQRYEGTINSTNAAAWTSLGAAIANRAQLTAGVRLDAYTRVHDVAVQPRGELQITLSPTLTARIAAGMYSRPPEHQTELLEPMLKAERATQLIAGVAYKPIDGLRLQGSLYATDRSQMITRDGDHLANTGTGTTYGAELLGTYARGPWFAWLAYSYSHSTRVDTPGGDERLFDYDQPHDLNIAGSYKLGSWTFGARFRLHSGLPITPVTDAIFDSDANLYYPAYGAPGSERAPIHHQLDIRIDKTWNWGPVKMTKFLDIQNVYLNDSVVTYFYGFDYTQRAAFHSLPIIPTAGLRGEF
jgi:outer membrane receptor protein involved in Fe transport